MDARKTEDARLALTAATRENRAPWPQQFLKPAAPLPQDFATLMRRVEAEVYDAA
jgi:hypothetical protein